MKVRIQVEPQPAQLENGWSYAPTFTTTIQVSATGQVDVDDVFLACAIRGVIEHLVNCHSKAVKP